MKRKAACQTAFLKPHHRDDAWTRNMIAFSGMTRLMSDSGESI